MKIEEVVGRPFMEEVLVEREARSWAQDKVRLVAGGEVAGPYENLWRTDYGSPRRVRWTLRPFSWPDGNVDLESSEATSAEVQYLILSGRDVTGQRQAGQSFLTNETRYKNVVEKSFGFVFTCTMEGRLTPMNNFSAESLGYRPEDLNGKPMTAIVSKGSIKSFKESLKIVVDSGEFQGTILFVSKDGKERQIAFRSRRMDLPGRPSSFLRTEWM